MATGLASRIVIFDLDNTLYDWLRYFAPAFRGLCASLAEQSGVPRRELEAEFRTIFDAHGSVEYSFAVQKLPSLLRLHPELHGAELVNRYWSAIELFQHRRRAQLRLYPGVEKGLASLGASRIQRVALTDGHAHHAQMRVRQLGLDRGLLDYVIARPNHPNDGDLSQIRRYEEDRYRANVVPLPTPDGLRKPNPELLLWVLDMFKASPAEALVVGDNLVRDVSMAQGAGIADCWAAYGVKYSPIDLCSLLSVTNWPEEAVQLVIHPEPSAVGVNPTFIAHDFADVVRFATLPELISPTSNMEVDDDSVTPYVG